MKSITLHPLSLAIGFVLAAGALGLVAAQTTGGSHAIPTKDIRVLGYVPAEQWVFVTVEASTYTGGVTTPFQVPSDRYFVVTDCQLLINQGATLLENGVAIADSRLDVLRSFWGTSHESRVAFEPGSLLSWSPLPQNAAARINFWGYLEPVR